MDFGNFLMANVTFLSFWTKKISAIFLGLSSLHFSFLFSFVMLDKLTNLMDYLSPMMFPQPVRDDRIGGVLPSVSPFWDLGRTLQCLPSKAEVPPETWMAHN